MQILLACAKNMTGLKAVRLPSTSPANASFSLQRLIDLWSREIRPYL